MTCLDYTSKGASFNRGRMLRDRYLGLKLFLPTVFRILSVSHCSFFSWFGLNETSSEIHYPPPISPASNTSLPLGRTLLVFSLNVFFLNCWFVINHLDLHFPPTQTPSPMHAQLSALSVPISTLLSNLHIRVMLLWTDRLTNTLPSLDISSLTHPHTFAWTMTHQRVLSSSSFPHTPETSHTLSIQQLPINRSAPPHLFHGHPVPIHFCSPSARS